MDDRAAGILYWSRKIGGQRSSVRMDNRPEPRTDEEWKAEIRFMIASLAGLQLGSSSRPLRTKRSKA